MSFEIIAALASALTSAVLASVALLFSYRQNVGWKPIAFLSGSSMKGGSLGPMSIVVTVEVWNRRKYPIVVRRLAMAVEGVDLLDRDAKEFGEEYVKRNILRREVEKPIPPGDHMSFDLMVQFQGQSLDAMRPLLAVKVQHFDPYRGKDRILDFRHKFFHPELGWKLTEKQREEARQRYASPNRAP